MPARRPTRARYHHGNLALALTDAAVTLAREGGPEAVVLREAARRVGVSATAAYRHFTDHEALMCAGTLRMFSPENSVRPSTRATVPPGCAHWASHMYGSRSPEAGLFRTAFHQAANVPVDLRSFPAYTALIRSSTR